MISCNHTHRDLWIQRCYLIQKMIKDLIRLTRRHRFIIYITRDQYRIGTVNYGLFHNLMQNIFLFLAQTIRVQLFSNMQV